MKIEKKSNFDIQDVGKNLEDAQNDKMVIKSNAIHINGVTIDLSDYTLILKRYGRNVKEKTLIDLACVQSTNVTKITKFVFLVIAIVSLVLGLGATYPLYIYFKEYGFIAGGTGILLFVIFLALYLASRQVKIVINLSNGKAIKYFTKDTKSFDKVNNFFDELFYKKHN